MESFGRMIAVSLSVVSLIILFLFYKTATVRWQKKETVRSMCHIYVADILDSKTVSDTDWKMFCTELNQLGGYRAEIVVYERKRYEGEYGRVYLFTEEKITEEKVLPEGSYVRLLVTEEKKSKAKEFIYGGACIVIAGGRIS